MIKKTITTPIVLLKLKGNFKEEASKINTTKITTFEKDINQTYIVIDVDNEEGADLKVGDFYKKKLGLEENDFISRQFSAEGMDFYTMI